MEVSIQKLAKSNREIKVEIPSEEFKGFLEKATFDLGKDLEVEGFRKGMAPKEIIEREIGLEKILNKAAEIAIKENYQKIILENKIEPIGQPFVEILKLPAPYRTEGSGAGAPRNPFEFKIKISVLPEIKLPDYREIVSQIKRKEVALLPEEIERLKREKERLEKEKRRQEILEKIVQASEIESPDILIEEEKKRMMEELKRMVPQILQMSFEDYLKKLGKSEKELVDSFLSEAEKRVKNSLALKEIGKLEKIEASEEEIQKEMTKILGNYPLSDELDRERLKEYTKEVIRNEKTFQLLEQFTDGH